MKIFFKLFCILILVNVSGLAETIELYSLPITITSSNVNDTFKVMMDNLEVRKHIFDFISGSHDVVIDLNGKTIYWGLDGSTPIGSSFPNGDMAFKMSGGGLYNIFIKNGTVLHNPPPESTIATHPLWAKGVRFGNNVHDVHFENVYFKVVGRNSQIAVKASLNVYNISFKNCIWESRMTALRDRTLWIENSTIAMSEFNSINYPDFKYHVLLEACSTVNSYWTNVYLQGDSLVGIVKDCYLMTDARNDNPNTSPPYNATECYALSLRIGGGGLGGAKVKILNNMIRSGNSYAGGRGIFLSGLDGISMHPDSCIYIYGNDIDVHQGFDGQFKTQIGIICREDWSRVWIENNKITVSSSVNMGSSYGDGEMSGLRLTMNTGDYFIFKNNHVKVQILDPLSGNLISRGACIISDESELNRTDIVIEDNILESNICLVRYGGVNNSGGFFDQKNNTYRYLNGAPYQSGFWSFNMGRPGSSDAAWEAGGHIIDGNFDEYLDTLIYMDDSEEQRHRLWLQVTLKIKVMDPFNYPFVGARVEIKNNYNQSFVAFTDNEGVATHRVTYWYEANTAGGQDSLLFNPFNLYISYGELSTNAQVIINSKNKEFNFNLGGNNQDVTPPNRIIDLKGLE